ncbi:hypothetical protein BDV59DRAFT_201301 [Aspergillus ambiguus]|uniref:uncharacterized protein n=1 Tax=Aspergillus ambiguus TaxID=176160 RepID=UPI003CCCCD9D
MVVSLLEYTILPLAQKVLKLDVSSDRKVGDFVNLLVKNGRHQYEFNGQGQVCRYWVDYQLDLFHHHGLSVSRSHIEMAKDVILTQWPDQMPYSLVQGAYYGSPVPF